MDYYIKVNRKFVCDPMIKRAARFLSLDVPTMIGHLMFLFTWSLAYATDGYWGDYSALEIAEFAMWKGEPEMFVKALVQYDILDGTVGTDLRISENYWSGCF